MIYISAEDWKSGRRLDEETDLEIVIPVIIFLPLADLLFFHGDGMPHDRVD